MKPPFQTSGEEAGEGNPKALEALKYATGNKHLKSFTPDAFGIAAAAGNAEALDTLLHYDRHGILLTSAVGALTKPAAGITLSTPRYGNWPRKG